MQTTLYLVRHAQARPLPEVPDAEWALSERGEAQARALVPVLARLEIDQIHCSPFRRCRDTLRPFAVAAGLELTVNDGLRERCLGTRWLGDFRNVWQRSWADFNFATDDGESSWVCRERIATAIGDLVRKHPGETLVLGSHGNSIGLLITTIEPKFGITEASALRTPEILKVVHDGKRLHWERTFSPGAEFEQIASDFRLTPGIVA